MPHSMLVSLMHAYQVLSVMLSALRINSSACLGPQATATWQLQGSYTAPTRQLHGTCMAAAKQLHGT